MSLLKVEAKFDGSTWVDITEDIIEGTLRFSSGNTSNAPSARVANIGQCSFDLDNSIQNSAGKAGYYSPARPECRSGFKSGLVIRVSAVFLSIPTPKWYGTIAPSGIDVDMGTSRNQRTHVTCYDYFYQLTNHRLKLMSYLTNVRGDQVIPSILANVPVQPLSTLYYTGQSTFATGMDKITAQTTAIYEIQKVTMSELGYCYLTHNRTSDECLVWEDRLRRNDVKTLTSVSIPPGDNGFLLNDTGGFITNDTGGYLLLAETKEISLSDEMIDMDYSHGDNLSNRIVIGFHPKKVDSAATTVLFTLNKPIAIAAGASITNYKITYRDPNGAATRTCCIPSTATMTLTANTAEDGTGTNITADITKTVTFGTESALIESATNGSASDGYITAITVEGQGIYDYDTISKIFEDTDFQIVYGTKELSVDLPYQSDPTMSDTIGAIILNQYKRPADEIKSVTFYSKNDDLRQIFITSDCGNRISLKESQTGIDEDYFINGWEAEWVAPELVKFTWYVKRASLDAQIFCKWDTASNFWDSSYGWGF